ncbi:hypothetical protein OHC33_008174 [Knufia fluminis]|uniref:Uncharacterized protein n=1 Tax=Knufia fluminis TaxID=191047 RepID=A0AAN8ENN1_9EURO|nr:hypothetical protein OHC33_008174 [Knufia fluminis]
MHLPKLALTLLAAAPAIVLAGDQLNFKDGKQASDFPNGADLIYCSSAPTVTHYNKDCWRAMFEKDKCVPLQEPDRTGDKDSVFWNAALNTTCKYHVAADCSDKGIGPAMVGPTQDLERDFYSTYTQYVQDVAHAYKCIEGHDLNL